MTKNEFLSILEQRLKKLPRHEREEILYDYNEHFDSGEAEGKTEEQISGSLGDPSILAKQFRASSAIKQAENSFSLSNIGRAVIAIISLGLFNLLFLAPIYLGIVAVLLGLFAASIGLFASGIAIFLAVLRVPFFETYVSYPPLNPGVIIFASTGTVSLGLLFFIGNSYLAQLLYKGTIKYLKLNLNIITKR